MAKTPETFLSGMRDQNGNDLEFLDIHRSFAETPMGQALATKARYDRYRPDSIPPAEWERLLGRDVNNLEHMPLTLELAQSFLKNMMTADSPTETHEPSAPKPRELAHFRQATPRNAEKPNDWLDAEFSPREIQIILLTAIVHDWAEADPALGDITYDLKKDTDEKKESQILVLMLRNQLGDILSPETLESVHKTATDKTGRLGEAFNIIERIGYLRTALSAWRATDNPIHSEELIESLKWLCSNVLANQIPALLKLFPNYDGVRLFLDTAAPLINDAFEQIPDSLFDHYPEGERETQRNKYLAAKTAWENF